MSKRALALLTAFVLLCTVVNPDLSLGGTRSAVILQNTLDENGNPSVIMLQDTLDGTSETRQKYEELLRDTSSAASLITTFEARYGRLSPEYVQEHYTELFDVTADEIDQGVLSILTSVEMRGWGESLLTQPPTDQIDVWEDYEFAEAPPDPDPPPDLAPPEETPVMYPISIYPRQREFFESAVGPETTEETVSDDVAESEAATEFFRFEQDTDTVGDEADESDALADSLYGHENTLMTDSYIFADSFAETQTNSAASSLLRSLTSAKLIRL
jgi:hypothetical protein